MKNAENRLRKLERQRANEKAERFTLTLGDTTLVFKNIETAKKWWINAVLSSDEEKVEKGVS